jgi:hypothetical protein
MIKILADGMLAALLAVTVAFKPFVIPSGAYLEDAVFSRDGSTLYATEVSEVGHVIVVSTLHHGIWSQPRAASFSGRWRDLEEVLSPDNRTMIFSSNRPKRAQIRPLDAYYRHTFTPGGGGNLWQTSWTGRGWTEPMRLPEVVNGSTSTFSPALAADGTLYYMQASGQNLEFHIFVARKEHGRYSTSELAPFSDLRYSDEDPTVAPDDSFVIFSSTRPPAPNRRSSLFITFNRNGAWTTPQFIGAHIAPDGAVESRLSPDLRKLYFLAGPPAQLERADVSSLEVPRTEEPRRCAVGSGKC